LRKDAILKRAQNNWLEVLQPSILISHRSASSREASSAEYARNTGRRVRVCPGSSPA
jgi:hypothetical protein